MKKRYIRGFHKDIVTDRSKILDPDRLEMIAHDADFKWQIVMNHNQPPGHYYGNPNRKRKLSNQLKNLEVVDEIVIHGTGSEPDWTTVDFFHWMMYEIYQGRNNEFKTRYKKYTKKSREGLFHYVIPRDGSTIYEIIDPSEYTCHSTSSSDKGDRRTIGIELINTSFNTGGYTPSQYKLLYALIHEYLIYRFPLINKISSHSFRIVHYNDNYDPKILTLKNCPGKKFDWGILESEWEKNGKPFKRISISNKKLKKAQKKMSTLHVPDMYEVNYWPYITFGYDVKELKKGVPIDTLAKEWGVTVKDILMFNRHLREFLRKDKGKQYYDKECLVYKPVINNS